MERLTTGLQIKSYNSDSGTFSGYGSIFGNIDSHRDSVAKGAFTETLAEARATGRWPKMLLMHGLGPLIEDQIPIGIWTTMQEDSTGLYVEGKLALGSRKANDVQVLLSMKPRPALNGLSIGYRPLRFRMHEKHEKIRRTLLAVHLDEISIVTDPSNPLATIANVKCLPRHEEAAARFSHALQRLAAAA